ncbi:MAG: 4-hydroxy-tetrahydrodipicolinate synthase [Alteromonadaceae bacterium]|jgi:4-hydroxy-tetrahydrodipicolinate synthase
MPFSSPNEMSSRAMNQKNTFENLNQNSLWTALITPLSASGDIDFTSLKSIAVTQAQAGNGLVLLGSTGEGLALTSQEQLSIVEFICQLSLNVPLMIAVGGYNLTEQINWISHCNHLPIAAYLLGSPIYTKPGPVGQTQWFSALLDAAQHPCMLYNVPSRSGVAIPISTLKALQKHKNCWALKEASGDITQFLAYRQHCPELSLFSGEDAMMPYLAQAGAKGLVSVCANAWPQATKLYVELSLQGETQSLFPLWNNAVDNLFQVASPIAVKALMSAQQAIETPNLLAPLTHLELTDNQALLTSDTLISQWFAEHQTSKYIKENH